MFQISRFYHKVHDSIPYPLDYARRLAISISCRVKRRLAPWLIMRSPKIVTSYKMANNVQGSQSVFRHLITLTFRSGIGMTNNEVYV